MFFHLCPVATKVEPRLRSDELRTGRQKRQARRLRHSARPAHFLADSYRHSESARHDVRSCGHVAGLPLHPQRRTTPPVVAIFVLSIVEVFRE